MGDFCAGVVLSFISCTLSSLVASTNVTESEAQAANEACVKNDGLSDFYVGEMVSSISVKCKDGARFTVTAK